MATLSIVAALIVGVPVVSAATPTTTTLDVPATIYAFAPNVIGAIVSPTPDGGSVRFTFRVSPNGTPGTVDAPVNTSTGRAEIEATSVWAGTTYNVTATYLPGAGSGYSGSTSPITQITPIKQLLELTLTVETPTIESGDNAVIKARLVPPPADYPDIDPAVHFSLGSNGQGARYDASVPVDEEGVATLTVPSSSLIPELWHVSAWFGPTRRYAGTPYIRDTFRYEPVPPLVSLVADPLTSYVGDPVTVTATVDPAPGDGGTIELFSIGPVGSLPQSLGSTPLAANGTAQFVRSFGQNEGLQLRAVFSGTATTPTSQSPIFERKQKGPPQTWITSRPGTWHPHASATFEFRSINNSFYMPAVSFQCRLDGAEWATCSSPFTTPALTDGPHTISIRGTDANGRVEPEPGVITWKIDTTGPTFSFTVNGGATLTNNPVVQLAISAQDQSSVNSMRIATWDHLDERGLLDGNGDRQFTANPFASLTEPWSGGTPDDGLKTVYLQLVDLLGNHSIILSQSIVLDTHAPDTLPPSVSIRTGKMGTTIPVNLTWPTPVDSVAGLANRTRYRSVDYGPWIRYPRTSSGSPNVDSLTNKSIYLYSQLATDKAGNTTPWVEAPAFKALIIQETSASLAFSGTWAGKSVTGASGGRVLRTRVDGASISTTFTGSAIGWVSTMGPKFGSARVYVDGYLVQTIHLHAAAKSTRQVVWSTSFATPGTHTVEVVADVTASRPMVDFDAFLELASVPPQ